MSTCAELESKILDRVAGAAAPGDAALLDAHLAGCPECRTWLSSCEEAVALAALPPLTDREERMLEALPGQARLAFRAQRRRARIRWAAAGVALAAAASVAVAVVVPGIGPVRGGGDGRVAAVDEGIPAADLSAWALADPLEEDLSSVLEDGDEGSLYDDEDFAVTEE
jgi:predicted anti-sigma-YlaC factor YlaD